MPASSPPLDIPLGRSQGQAAVHGTHNTPTAGSDHLAEFPFGQHGQQSLDLSKLDRKMHNIEMMRLSDELAFTLEAH